MARAKSKSSASKSSRLAKPDESDTTKKASPDKVAEDVIDLIEEMDAREELRQVIREKDAQYQKLLNIYNALKASTLSKLHASIDRITLEATKIKQTDAEPVIEQLNEDIVNLNSKLETMDRLKAENEMLKNETRALHQKVRCLEKKLAEMPESPSRKQTHIDNASAQLIIELYQCMLGMRILPQSKGADGTQIFKCRMIDRQTRRVIEFNVTTSESDEVECCPTRIDVGDSRECDFLKEGPIQFDLDLMSRFTKKLLTAIQQS